MNGFGGIHCVLYALFDASGALDRGAMREQTQRVLSAGVDGITVLGLATEVQKLTVDEQCSIIDWAAEDISQSVQLSVTISGNSVAAQRRIARYSLDHGAGCLILQPPSAGTYPGETYVEFFARVADGMDATFAVQNAPQYLGRALTNDQLSRLRQQNSGFCVVKSETSANDLATLVAELGAGVTVLNGRGGLEMTDCLRAGAHGFILAPDGIDHCQRIFDLWNSGGRDSAERAYSELLPAIVFMMQSIEHLICYGKRIFGYRTGMEIHDRLPAMLPSEFGIQCAKHWARHMKPFNEQ